MSLPETVRVKLSSEAAEAISITPVVVREIPIRELVEYMLGLTGKDASRVRELLLRGTLVSGASRFRWAGWEADLGSIHVLLATFPDPARPFAAERCVRVILRGGRHPIDIPRQAGARKTWLRRRSFWDVLMEVASGAECRYAGYSYREHADVYQFDVAPAHLGRLRGAAAWLKYSSLRDQVRQTAFFSAELYVERS